MSHHRGASSRSRTVTTPEPQYFSCVIPSGIASATDFGPTDPAKPEYPGKRPGHSFVQDDRDEVLTLTPTAEGSWSVWDGFRTIALDAWLAAQGASLMQDRIPVLSYGSNACPFKLLDLHGRRPTPLPGPVPMTRCTVTGLAAAWCKGTRSTDGLVPATLIQAAGTEEHFLWWVSADQWDALDECEGRGSRYYSLVELDVSTAEDAHGAGRPGLRSEGGRDPGPVFAYVGMHERRLPMAGADGGPLLVRNLHQDKAAAHLATRPVIAVTAGLGKVVPYGTNPTPGSR